MEKADRRLLDTIQDGLPLVSHPFRTLGDSLEMSESEVIVRLERLQEEGIIRRIGPILDMRKLGCSGVLVAIKVPPDQADEVANIVNEYKEVSHNYLRPNDSGYNIWFTVSAREERIHVILAEIRDRTGLDQLVLPTKKIFKIGVKFDII